MKKILFALLEIFILDVMLIGFYILFKQQVTDLILICFVMIIVCFAVGKSSNGRYLFRYINGAIKKYSLVNVVKISELTKEYDFLILKR